MIKPFLPSEEVTKLNAVIEQANKSFLKESRLSSNLSFNILRILSAFRLIYPDSPASLYNAIIYITKNYNPTSFNQWKAAVNQLSKLRRHVEKEKHYVARQQAPSYMKTYQNSFNKQRIEDAHFQSKSFAQIKIPADLNLSEESGSLYEHQNKDISQTNAETGKRQFYTKTDTTQYQQKNHYISFEPYHHISGIYPHSYFEKENVNSTNIGQSRKKDSSYQYLEAIRRDLGRTTKNSLVKSPIDQSFIKNIDCYESPYLLSHPDLLAVDPEEQRMNERAYGFLRYNLLFKSFSSILANTLVLQKAKEQRLKADTQNKSNVLQKSFQGLRHNVQLSKMIKQKQREADQHFRKQMKGKVLSVFKLIFDLRSQMKPLKIEALNRSSYEFVLKMLLSTKKEGESSQNSWIDFNLKIDELIRKDEIDKVCMVVKYFGKHSWISQEPVQNLISSYRLSICKLVFRSLKLQQQNNQRYFQLRQKKLITKAYNVLKSRWSKVKSYNTKILQGEARRNRILLQKVMKSLLQIVYSTKLYSKRCEHLQKKRQMITRKNILGVWLKETKCKLTKIQHLKENIKISQLSLNKFYKKYSFRVIKQDGFELQEKIQLVEAAIANSKSKGLIFLLKQLLIRQCQSLRVKAEMKRMWKKSTLLRWKSSTKKGKGINLIFGVLKKYAFRCFVSPVFKESIELINEIKQGQISNAKLVLNQWKAWTEGQTKKYEHLIQSFRNKMLFKTKLSLINLLSSHYRYEQQQRNKQERKAKSLTIAQYFQLKSKKAIISNLMMLGQRRQQQKVNFQEAKSRLAKIRVKLTFGRFQAWREHQLKMNSIKQIRIENSASAVMRKVKDQLLAIKQTKGINLRKSKALSQLGKISFRLKKQQSEKQLKAQKHLYQKYLAKTIVSLYELVQQRDELKKLVQQTKQKRRLQLLKSQIKLLRDSNKIRKISNRINKRSLFYAFRSNKDHLTKTRELAHFNFEAASKAIFSSLKFQLQSKQNAKLVQQKTSYLTKYIFTNRIQNYFVKSLIFKKYLFMSIKYRALKMCSVAFNVWKSRKFPQKVAIKPKDRVPKGKDRLSTDVM